MINKQQAHTLAGYGYKLQDKEGDVWVIDRMVSDGLFLKNGNKQANIYFEEIGTDYFILSRDLSQLIQPITHEGKEFIPIVELAKVEGMFLATTPIEHGISTTLKFPYAKQNNIRFCFYEGNFGLFIGEKPNTVANQQRLFNLLYEWNFAVLQDVSQEYYKSII